MRMRAAIETRTTHFFLSFIICTIFISFFSLASKRTNSQDPCRFRCRPCTGICLGTP